MDLEQDQDQGQMMEPVAVVMVGLEALGIMESPVEQRMVQIQRQRRLVLVAEREEITTVEMVAELSNLSHRPA
jgi:hypothetical protein